MSGSRCVNVCSAFLLTVELCLFYGGESTTISPRCAPGHECNSLGIGLRSVVFDIDSLEITSLQFWNRECHLSLAVKVRLKYWIWVKQRSSVCDLRNNYNNHYLDPTTVEMPEAAKVIGSKCPLEMETYCYNGECIHIESDNISFCKCDKGYFGNRCMHIELVRQPLTEEDVALAVAVSFLVLIGVLIATWLIYIRCKKSRSKPEYTGVTATTTTTSNCIYVAPIKSGGNSNENCLLSI